MFLRFVKNSPYQILSFSPLFNNLNFSTIVVMTTLILLYLSVFMLLYLADLNSKPSSILIIFSQDVL